RILAGIHELHPGMLRRLRDIDGHDFRMRPVGPHEVRVELARQLPVGRVLAGARNQAEILYSAVRMRGVRVQGAEVQPVLLARGSGGLYTVGFAGLLRSVPSGAP